jgi:hypothetical protein
MLMLLLFGNLLALVQLISCEIFEAAAAVVGDIIEILMKPKFN